LIPIGDLFEFEFEFEFCCNIREYKRISLENNCIPIDDISRSLSFSYKV